jgi:hypothetical protein
MAEEPAVQLIGTVQAGEASLHLVARSVDRRIRPLSMIRSFVFVAGLWANDLVTSGCLHWIVVPGEAAFMGHPGEWARDLLISRDQRPREGP